TNLEELDGLPVLNLNRPPERYFLWGVKRVIDIVFSVGFLLALTIIPLIPLIIIAIKLDSKGPVFYKQKRIGLDGKEIKIFKFRSMVSDAEAHTGPVFADENDSRTTKVGKFLRCYNLDEIPQFINVIKGDMSVVGPRPERPNFVRQFKKEIPHYMLRHKVKSGITGWAQVNGWRGKTSIKRRIEFDLYYIQNWSLGLDIKIMWRTFIHWILKRPIDESMHNNQIEKDK
ncbi:MAG: exopolysaccharide biosynthesis polyprenyl glycosylphosphotransferase, partial [Acidobacteria bacterium]|nr:exopolysaccharide biosynthesis polyprenyl glycosylphosphotransferase [Acidobacteriota bacterium]